MPEKHPINRDVTVNGQSISIHANVPDEIMRFGGPEVDALIESDLDMELRRKCQRRWGEGELVKLSEGKYSWQTRHSQLSIEDNIQEIKISCTAIHTSKSLRGDSGPLAVLLRRLAQIVLEHEKRLSDIPKETP